MMAPYLNAYIKLRKYSVQGEPELFQGIIYLYDPNHHLSLNRVLQIGDARKMGRPATGYGFIPALWQGLFGCVSTSIALAKHKLNFKQLDGITEKLFNLQFLYSYTWNYGLQLLYMNADWDLMDSVFQIVKEIVDELGSTWPGFFDRMTLSHFTRNDLQKGLSKLLIHILKNPHLIGKIPANSIIPICKTITLNYLLHFANKFH